MDVGKVRRAIDALSEVGNEHHKQMALEATLELDNIASLEGRMDALEQRARDGGGIDGAIRLIEFVDRERYRASAGKYSDGYERGLKDANAPRPAGLLLPWGSRICLTANENCINAYVITPDNETTTLIFASHRDFGLVATLEKPAMRESIMNRLLLEGKSA